MTRQGRYPQEAREGEVRMVFEHQDEHHSQWAAITSIAAKFGVWRRGRPEATKHRLPASRR